MMGFIIAIHVIACILLIALVLIQRGRGGGLVESFSGVESMFGPKTDTFLTRSTTILSVLFFITCLSLALLSARQSRSLMRDIKTSNAPLSKPLGEAALPPQSTQAPQPTQTPQAPQPAQTPQPAGLSTQELPKPETPPQELPKTETPAQ